MEQSRQMKRYYKIRNEVIRVLGGKCSGCGETKDLQMDHIDRKTKSIDVAKIFNLSFKRIMEEAGKCQLLCKKCHNEKTILETGHRIARDNHGTISTYRYCKCQECVEAKRRYSLEYYKTHKRITDNQGRRIIIKR